MTIYDIIFTLQFLVMITVVLAKIYNLSRIGEWYDRGVSWVLFIAGLFFWGVGLITVILGYNELLYVTLFGFERGLLLLLVICQIAEIFLHYKLLEGPIKAMGSR